ncbi:cadherin-related family member 4-like [Amia ocellicauda]|uniref:cadherin-related family member 4-like n=1 Tax=Amia ocellicauda TaxID=2972642 RepID=UPI003464D202
MQIKSVIPSNVFEEPIVSKTKHPDIFSVEIRLNASLDFESVHIYTIFLRLVTANSTVEENFNVFVIDVNEPPTCFFQFPGAEVQVPESLSVPAQIYQVLASDPDQNDTLSDFIIYVTVTDQGGESCSGTLSLKVLKVFIHPLTFINPSQNVTIYENSGENDYVATVTGNGSNIHYDFVDAYQHFNIEQGSGIIRTAYSLDLEREPVLQYRVLMVRAYSTADLCSGTATVAITVLDVNEYPPLCFPPVLVLTVSETTAVGKSLGTVKCYDPDASKTALDYQLLTNSNSLFKFRLQNGQLQVNTTLDYDNAAIALNNFQYQATILVNDSGIPSLTTAVRVLVTVTPVNEYEPQFQGPFVFNVNENTPRAAVIGAVKATDRDWDFNAIRYSIINGEGFSIDPQSGELYLRRSLDFEHQTIHHLRVQAMDYNQDVDPSMQKSTSEDFSIHVQNINDNPPVCNPFLYESTIYSTLASGEPIITLSCMDIDNNVLTAKITNGAVTDRFSLNGMNLISKNIFSYNPEGLFDRTTFEVNIEVSDGKHSTEVVAIIHVIPWTTTVPTTTTTTTTRAPQVVTIVQTYWEPDIWFVAVLTVTGALVLICLGLLIWKILVW